MLERIGYLIEHKHLIRRVLLLLSVIFLGIVTYWSMWFASHAPKHYDTAGIGVIIAAVQAPCTLLMGHIMSLYNAIRKNGGGG